MEFKSKFIYFHSRKCSSNIVFKMAAILSRPQSVSDNPTIDRNLTTKVTKISNHGHNSLEYTLSFSTDCILNIHMHVLDKVDTFLHEAYEGSTIDYGYLNLMMSSIGNIFCVTGPLCGEFTGHRWIPLTKPSDAELRSFLCSAPE